MNALAFASVTVALLAVACGLTIANASTARISGGLLAISGFSGLAGLWLVNGAHDAGKTLLLIGGLVLFPASLWAYPRPAWHQPLDKLLAAALVAPGVVAVIDQSAATTLPIVSFLALVAQTWWRLESSDANDRRALSWLALTACVVTLASFAIGFLSSADEVPAGSIAVLAAIPIAMTVGVLKPETMDVQGLAVSATVIVTLSIGYVAYFVGTLAILDLLGVREVSPLALAAIGLVGAYLLRPAGHALRSVMDNLLFGERPDPLLAANAVVGRIGQNPTEALDAVRSALTLPFAELLRGDEVIARSGAPVAYTRTIAARDTDITLSVGLRPGDLTLPAADLAVLQLVTPLLVQIVRATDLSAAVQRLRTAEINAIAEERRRLRAELHDDLGPTLAGIAFTTDAARNLVRQDPATAMDLLMQVREDTSAAIARIRQIVYGMRPAALAELGLIEAIRQYRRAGLRVVVQAQDPLPDLGAATEVAAYRVITEALENAARHSRGSTATVTVSTCSVALTIEIVDNGASAVPWRPGVGMTSMRDRVMELGGEFSAGPDEHGGKVTARLPLAAQ